MVVIFVVVVVGTKENDSAAVFLTEIKVDRERAVFVFVSVFVSVAIVTMIDGNDDD